MPGTYRLEVTSCDYTGESVTQNTESLVIERAVSDKTLIRKFVEAGIYSHRSSNHVVIKRFDAEPQVENEIVEIDGVKYKMTTVKLYNLVPMVN